MSRCNRKDGFSKKEGSSSYWFNLNESPGKRRSGIYKISKLKRENYIVAHFIIIDNEISEDFKCLEIVQQYLSDLKWEIGIPLKEARQFYYDKNILEKITTIAKR